ncbi:MAG: hypothetical protein AAFQ89_09970 [Cyanobacteria bacterium J06626_18]
MVMNGGTEDIIKEYRVNSNATAIINQELGNNCYIPLLGQR